MSDFQHDVVYDHIVSQAALELNIPVQGVEDLVRSEHLRLVSLSAGQVIGGYFYTPGQAAELLGQNAFEINLMIHHEQLPKILVYNQRWIPVQSVENLMSESAQQERNKSRLWPEAHWIEFSDDRDATEKQRTETETSRSLVSSETTVRHNFLKDSSQRPSASTQPQSSTSFDEKLETIRERLNAEKEQRKRLEENLNRERAEHKQIIKDTRYEIDQLNAERENLGRNHSLERETLQRELNEERDKRIRSERQTELLQNWLDKERSQRLMPQQTQEEAPSEDNIYEQLRSGVTDFMKSFQGSVVDDNEEEQLAHLEAESKSLRSELEEERNRRLRREEWVIDLQAKLEANETQLREFRESLGSEQEKILRLEKEKDVLDKIRLLLSPMATGPVVRTEGVAATDITDVEPESNSTDLQIQTRHGLWIFRPPFTLESDEVELIRLVAGEDEIKAEQIKRRTGRRRSVDDLDELLDRLLAEGIEPIKESNDTYSFDPDFLQD